MAETEYTGLRAVLNEAAKRRQVRRYYPKNGRAYDCSHVGCGNQAYAKGYCNAHYLRARNGLDMERAIKHRNANKVCDECAQLVGSKGGWGLCKQHYKRLRRQIIKAYFVERMGGRCSACKNQFPLAVYDFHHTGDKDIALGDFIDAGSAARIEAEMAKCVLLCANCHRVHHNS
jgi:hypothetical protein